jgi:hypothetical protein
VRFCLAIALLFAGCETSRAAPPIDRPPAPIEVEVRAREVVEEQRRIVRLSASGDLVLNSNALDAIEDDGGYGALLASYAECLREDEISILNLEQPLVDDLVPLDPGWPRQNPAQPRRSPVLGATPALADALFAAGIDAVSLSNNHAYDQGRRGLARTIEELARARVKSFGAARSIDGAFASLVIDRVAFLSFSEFFNQQPSDAAVAMAAPFDEERVRQAIARARENADLVVVAIHWGRDFDMRVRDRERTRARELIEMGADVILGAGPHVLHSIEVARSPRGEALIAYSLGNAASGMGRTYRIGQTPNEGIHPANVRPEARDGIVLHASIEVGGSIAIRDLYADALWTENNWLEHRSARVAHRVRVRRMREVPLEVQRERLPLIRAAIGDRVRIAE